MVGVRQRSPADMSKMEDSEGPREPGTGPVGAGRFAKSLRVKVGVGAAAACVAVLAVVGVLVAVGGGMVSIVPGAESRRARIWLLSGEREVRMNLAFSTPGSCADA